MDEIEQAGDYWYNPACDADGNRSLWFMLPGAASRDHFAEPFNRRNGLNRIASPIWSITENADATLTSSPSIAIEGHDPTTDAPGATSQYFHGYLINGNWREV